MPGEGDDFFFFLNCTYFFTRHEMDTVRPKTDYKWTTTVYDDNWRSEKKYLGWKKIAKKKRKKIVPNLFCRAFYDSSR